MFRVTKIFLAPTIKLYIILLENGSCYLRNKRLGVVCKIKIGFSKIRIVYKMDVV
jgi:hypothetical protein